METLFLKQKMMDETWVGQLQTLETVLGSRVHFFPSQVQSSSPSPTPEKHTKMGIDEIPYILRCIKKHTYVPNVGLHGIPQLGYDHGIFFMKETFDSPYLDPFQGYEKGTPFHSDKSEQVGTI